MPIIQNMADQGPKCNPPIIFDRINPIRDHDRHLYYYLWRVRKPYDPTTYNDNEDDDGLLAWD
jgi:hypothetical protein